MVAVMRRLLASTALATFALGGLSASASAATHTPTITGFSPAQVAVGKTLIIKGKNFRKGVKNNRVFFSRATDGKTVRARPSKANSTTRMEVVVPAAVSDFLTVTKGVASPTRFQLQVLSGRFSKKTAKSRSPFVLPAGTSATPGAPGTTAPGTTGPGGVTLGPPDCNKNGVPDSSDPADSDGDGLPDNLEVQLKTDACNKDTDLDGVTDGYEYYSARDLNGNALPYPGKKPYPNPLDGTDAKKDFDGDGMTQAEEWGAWVYSGAQLPSGPGQSFPYSDGNQTSPAPSGSGYLDLNENSVATDDEKDVDGDGIPNWVELAKGESGPNPAYGCDFSPTTAPNPVLYANAFTDCGSGPMPNGLTFGAAINGLTTTGGPTPPYIVADRLNYIDPDTDGDGVADGADDNDFDGYSNRDEFMGQANGYFSEPDDPCDPNPNSRTCPVHPSHNS